MPTKTKRILIILAIMIFGVVFAWVFNKTWAGILAGLIGGLIGGFIVSLAIKDTVNKEVEKAVETIIPTTRTSLSSDELISSALQGLNDVNLHIRMTPNVPAEVIKLVEQMVDDLRIATPSMIERHPDHDLTYELKKMCNEHLMKQLKEFFEMSPENITKYLPDLMSRLNDMGKHISRAKEIAEGNEVAEMKAIAGFLDAKYSKQAGVE
ncbi:hypothetical protein KAR91_86265 [Candidatus Pacearchaeota archaeon]|nr:hypothetical protein [Candidatus Pacearchaeota archaeon]